MKLYFDLDRRVFLNSLTDRREMCSISAKRGDLLKLEVFILDSAGATMEIEDLETMVFAVKESPATASDLLVFADEFVFDETSEGYESDVSINGEDLTTLIGDSDFVDLEAEISLESPTIGIVTSKTLAFRAENDIWKGDEGTPLELTNPDQWLSARAVRYDQAQTLTGGQQTQARSNIGLGNSATLNVGTTAGTVAAGDHTHDAADLVSGTIDEARFPDVITVDGVTLSDGSAVELPDGTLALDASNPPKLMIHDGDTPGGVPAEGWILRGAASFNLATDNVATEKVITLADLVLPLGFIPNTTGVEKMFIQGSVNIHANGITNYNPSIDPRLLFYLVEAPGASGSPRGISSIIGTLGISDRAILFSINSSVDIAYTAGGPARITTTAGPNGQSIRRNITSGGIVTDTNINLTNYGTIIQYTATATGPITLRCAIILPPDAATANATGLIRAACNLRLHFA